ncbi:hypothetical protein ACFL0V_03830, partial [Nanoarchaeota archaeon]
MSTVKKMLKSVRFIILLVFVILAIVAIHPNPGADGVAIRSVTPNSSASVGGIESPKPTAPPMSRERILFFNNQPVADEAAYFEMTSDLRPNQTIQLKTTGGFYQLKVKPLYKITELNETENVTFEETKEVVKKFKKKSGEVYNKTVNVTENITKEVPKILTEVVGVEKLGLRVYEAPKTNIRKGLDLQGGTRVLLKPEKEVATEDMELIISNLKQRLNVFGLSDVVVREASDLEGAQFILVEIAGADEDEVRDLISKQGKFEAKIGNETVFIGGNDITYVCRTADCSGIDPQRGCGQVSETEWSCAFRFSISLNPEAAEKQAGVTEKLDLVPSEDGGDEYLSKKLQLYLDDALVDELNIGADLKGRAVTDIMISGGGQGTTNQEAIANTLTNMKRLQTILITGSLPVKLEVMKTDAISPVLGKDFVKNALLMAIIAIIVVSLVIWIRYRNWRVAAPMMFTMVAEVALILGVGALIQWNIDMAAIAGIIVAVGTGVDDQIVIADETLRGDNRKLGWKEKLKRA